MYNTHSHVRSTPMAQNSVDDLSWNADSFWAKVRLFLASYRQNWAAIMGGNAASQSAASSALSSTFYSIVGTAHAKLSEVGRQEIAWRYWYFVTWFWTWGLLGGYCYLAMQWHSNAVDIRTADQADIRQSILRRTRRYAEAITLIREFYENSAGHTRGLLAVGLADCYGYVEHVGSARERTRYINEAVDTAHQVSEAQPAQAARILRKVADLLTEDRKVEEANRARQQAISIAAGIGAKDQILKAGK